MRNLDRFHEGPPSLSDGREIEEREPERDNPEFRNHAEEIEWHLSNKEPRETN